MANFSSMGKYSGRLRPYTPKQREPSGLTLINACKIEDPPPPDPTAEEKRKWARLEIVVEPIVDWICQCTKAQAAERDYGAWDATIRHIKLSHIASVEDARIVSSLLNFAQAFHDEELQYWPPVYGDKIVDLPTGRRLKIAKVMVKFTMQKDCRFPKNYAVIILQAVCRLSLSGLHFYRYCARRRAELGGVFEFGLECLDEEEK